MPQVTRCPHCSKSLQIADDSVGKPVRCPLCQQLFAVRAAVVAQATPVMAAPVVARSQTEPQRARAAPVAEARAEASGGAVRARGRQAVLDPPHAFISAPPHHLTTAPAECPSCRSRLLAGATACMNCGYVLSAPEPALEAEAAPNLCPNPACAVANPALEHVCQRCGSPLPIAPGTVLHGGYRIEGLLAI